MIDHAFEESGLHVLDEVIVGDAFQLDDGDVADILETEVDESAIIEPAQAMLEPVVERA
jgi:hypothetical protein